MFTQLGFEAEGLLKDHVRSQSGEVHDLLVLSHFVEELWATMATTGVDELVLGAESADAADGAAAPAPAARRRRGAGRAALRPERPDRLPRAMVAMAAYGPDDGRRHRRRHRPLSAGARHVIDDARVAHLRRAVAGDRRHRPRAAARAASARRAPSGSSPATTAVSCMASSPRRSSAPTSSSSTPGFAGPQLADVVDHEGIDTVLHDDDFADIVAACGRDRGDRRRRAGGVRAGPLADTAPADATRRARMVILTSGTTGRPKGAARGSAGGVDALTPLLSRWCRSAPATRSSSPLRCSTPGGSRTSASGWACRRRPWCRPSSTPRPRSPRSPSTGPAGSSSCP